MTGVRVGKFGAVLLLTALVAVFAGCSWQEVPCGEEETVQEMAVDYIGQAALDSLKQRVSKLEKEVVVNADAAREAQMTADKALKCCRKEFVTIMSEEVYYAFNSSALDAASMEKLDRIASKLKEDPDYIIEIAGHTDAVGGSDYNIVLGQRRADAVRAYLIDKHRIAFSRISIRSGGTGEPIASNDTDQGRARNRRATISVLGYSLE